MTMREFLDKWHMEHHPRYSEYCADLLSLLKHENEVFGETILRKLAEELANQKKAGIQ